MAGGTVVDSVVRAFSHVTDAVADGVAGFLDAPAAAGPRRLVSRMCSAPGRASHSATWAPSAPAPPVTSTGASGEGSDAPGDGAATSLIVPTSGPDARLRLFRPYPSRARPDRRLGLFQR